MICDEGRCVTAQINSQGLLAVAFSNILTWSIIACKFDGNVMATTAVSPKYGIIFNGGCCFKS